jgi:hypothetical protein
MVKRKETATPEPEQRRERPHESDHTCGAQFCPATATIFDTLTGPARNGLCRYHQAAPPHLWPQVSQILNRTQSADWTDRELAALGVRVTVNRPASASESTGETPKEILARLQRLLSDSAPVDDSWARKLKARHEAGEQLHLCQVRAYQAALGGEPESEDAREARFEREAIQGVRA